MEIKKEITLTRKELDELYLGFEHFFPAGGILADTPIGNWKDRNTFIKDVRNRLGIDISKATPKDIKDLEQSLETIVTEKEKGGANVPDEVLREQQENERVKREEAQKTANENAKRDIERKIKILEERQAKINEERRFIKIEEPPEPKIDPEKLQIIEGLRNEAKKDPEQYYKDLAENLKGKLSGQLPEAEANFIAEKVALDVTNGLIDPASQKVTNMQVAVLNKVSEDMQFSEVTRQEAGELSFYLSNEFSRNIIGIADKDIAFAAFGSDPANYSISFSNKATSGFTSSLDPAAMNEGYSRLLENQGAFFQQISGMTQQETQNFLMSQARSWLDGQIGGLSPEIVGVYNSSVVQQGLEFVGLGKAVPFAESSIGQAAMKLPGASSFFEGLGKVTGIDFMGSFGGKVATDAAKSIGKEAAVQAGKAAITAGGEAAVGGIAGLGIAATITAALAPVLGPLAPIAGAIGAFLVETVGTQIIGKVVSKVVGWIKSKIPLGEIKKWSAIVVGGLAALIAIPFVGIGGALGIGLGTTAVSAAFGGGLGGATLGGIGGAVAGFFGALGAATLGAIGTPILVAFLGFPVAVALILFIINSGAYVVPPELSQLSSTNPYIDVQKTADPGGKVPSPTKITYTVTITAKKDPLTNISFQNKCQGIKKSGGNLDCKNLEQIPSPPPIVSPGTPFTFTFTSDYDSKYQNTLVANTITVFANSEGGGNVSETGAASVCFGDCPLNCFKTVDNEAPWPSNFKSNLDAAAAMLGSTYPNFAVKACAAGTINLCYTTSNPSPVGNGLCNGTIYARHIHTSSCDINFNQCGIRNQSDALFMLTHEVTHHIQTIAPNYERLFEQQVPRSEWPICTYGATNGDPYESQAEGDALFVEKPSWNSCANNYASLYPKHYSFAKNCMFGANCQ